MTEQVRVTSRQINEAAQSLNGNMYPLMKKEYAELAARAATERKGFWSIYRTDPLYGLIKAICG